jgi:hypothetical protein
VRHSEANSGTHDQEQDHYENTIINPWGKQHFKISLSISRSASGEHDTIDTTNLEIYEAIT